MGDDWDPPGCDYEHEAEIKKRIKREDFYDFVTAPFRAAGFVAYSLYLIFSGKRENQRRKESHLAR